MLIFVLVHVLLLKLFIPSNVVAYMFHTYVLYFLDVSMPVVAHACLVRMENEADSVITQELS